LNWLLYVLNCWLLYILCCWLNILWLLIYYLWLLNSRSWLKCLLNWHLNILCSWLSYLYLRNLWLWNLIYITVSNNSRFTDILWFWSNGINLLYLWLVNNLFLDSLIFNSLLVSFLSLIFIIYFFLWNIVDIFISICMWDIFSLMFNSIIVCKSFFMWDCFNSLYWLIIYMGSFIWDIFNSTFSFNISLLLTDCSFVFCICLWNLLSNLNLTLNNSWLLYILNLLWDLWLLNILYLLWDLVVCNICWN